MVLLGAWTRSRGTRDETPIAAEFCLLLPPEGTDVDEQNGISAGDLWPNGSSCSGNGNTKSNCQRQRTADTSIDLSKLAFEGKYTIELNFHRRMECRSLRGILHGGGW